MTIADIIKNIEILETRGDLLREVASICYDSRNCLPGSMFVAVRGLRVDGHDYINEAVTRGAAAVVHEGDVDVPPEVTSVRVADTRVTLGKLGRNFHGDPSASMLLVGVVGTNGKTTVTYLVESILQAAGYRCGVLGTVNYRYGGRILSAPNTTPESYEMQRILAEMGREGIDAVVAEVSSHALDLHRVDDCAFDLGIFTNLSQDHLDYHGTMERYFQAKRRFFTEVLPSSGKGRAVSMVINVDDPWGRRILEDCRRSAWTYAVDTEAHIRPRRYECTLDGIRADIETPGRRFSVTSPLMGKFNLENLLAATAATLALDVPLEAVVTGIASLRSVPGRLERVNETGQPHVFVDYAHTEDALRRVLENLGRFKRGRIITVLGCGGDRDRGKRPLMGRTAVRGSDVTIITSDNPRTEDPMAIIGEIESGIPADVIKVPPDASAVSEQGIYTVIPDRGTAIEMAVRLASPEDMVLIAGKGHENYQIVGERKIFFDDRLAAREALWQHHRRRGAS